MFEGFVSAANSTTTPLLAAAVFTGTFEDVKDFGSVVVAVITDVASAADGLRLEWSTNGSDIDFVETFTLAPNVGQSISPTIRARYFRIKLTNGGSNQTVLRLQTLYTYSRNNAKMTVDGSVNISAGSITIVDGGGSITVDGTVTVAAITAALPTGDNTIGRVKITDGTNVASVRDTGSSDSLNVAIVDASGNQIVSFGGGSQYTEGDTDASITGTAIMWEDTADTLQAVSAAKPLPISDAGGSLTVDGTVTIQDGGNVISIDDAGGSLTVDGTVAVSAIAGALPAGDAVIGRVKLTDGTDVASIRDLTNSDPLDVAIVDGSGNQITSFGGGTEYTEGDTDASITGTAMLWEDTADTLRAISAAKPLPVNVVAGGGGGMTDDSAFTPASSTVSPMGAFCDETSPDSVDEGDIGAVRMAADRILLQDLRRITNAVSADNTTAAVLGAAAVFTGTADDVTNYAAVTLTIRASHASAADGISIEWSSDGGSNWDRTEKYTYTADKPFAVTLRPKGTHYRVVYTNGATLQTTFRLKSIFHLVPPTADQSQISGRVTIDGVTYPVKWSAINATASGDNTVLSLVTGKKLRILGIAFTCSNNVDIIFKSGSNTLISAMSFSKWGGIAVNDQPAGFFAETNAGEAFIMNLSAAINVRGRCYYAEI